jgi:murein DD-endopeptidase MepM/ murein hydrolase activator NlpD
MKTRTAGGCALATILIPLALILGCLFCFNISLEPLIGELEFNQGQYSTWLYRPYVDGPFIENASSGDSTTGIFGRGPDFAAWTPAGEPYRGFQINYLRDANDAKESFMCRAPTDIVNNITGWWREPRPVTASYTYIHEGTDFGSPCGQEVHTPMGGYIVWAEPTANGYGRYVAIQNHGWLVGFAHLRKIAINPRTGQPYKRGDWVDANEVIGISGGDTSDAGRGLSTGCHLHFNLEEWDPNCKTGSKEHPQSGCWVARQPCSVLLPGQNALCEYYPDCSNPANPKY